MTIYATYFDSGYLIRGLACIESLLTKSTEPVFIVVLALDPDCAAAVSRFAQRWDAVDRIDVLTLDQIEEKHPELLSVKSSRSRIEYYFTLTPYLCCEALLLAGVGDYAIYLDADLYFYSDPNEALTPVGGAAVAVVEHRYPARLEYLVELYGRFNVGWVAFRRSPEAFSCIERWQAQCLQWCGDQPKDRQFGDQKYLDEWPDTVLSLKVNAHACANYAPWNISRHKLSVEKDGSIRVDGENLVFFHFHHLHRLSASTYEADYRDFGKLEPLLCEAVYGPYLLTLGRLEKTATELLGWKARSSIRYQRRGTNWLRWLVYWPWRTIRLFLGRRVIFENGRALPAMQGLRYDC